MLYVARMELWRCANVERKKPHFDYRMSKGEILIIPLNLFLQGHLDKKKEDITYLEVLVLFH